MHTSESHDRGPLIATPLHLVMDVPNSIIVKASEEALLQPLSRSLTCHRVSLYADDLPMFVKPTHEDLATIKSVFEVFGDA